MSDSGEQNYGERVISRACERCLSGPLGGERLRRKKTQFGASLLGI